MTDGTPTAVWAEVLALASVVGPVLACRDVLAGRDASLSTAVVAGLQMMDRPAVSGALPLPTATRNRRSRSDC